MKLCNQIQCEILFLADSGRLTHLAVIHLGLHHPFHVLFLHGGGHTEAVAHAQDFRPAIWVRHLHWAVQNHRPRIQLQQRYNDKLTVRQRRTWFIFNVVLQFKSLLVCIINLCGEIQNVYTGTSLLAAFLSLITVENMSSHWTVQASRAVLLSIIWMH